MNRVGGLLKLESIEYIQSFDISEAIPLRFSSQFHTYRIYYIPTETVVIEPEFVTPQEGRIYRVNLYLRDGIVYEYAEISKLPGFKGTYIEKELYLVEIYEDGGDDGHIRYVLQGYALMTKEQIDGYLDKNRFKRPPKNYWGY